MVGVGRKSLNTGSWEAAFPANQSTEANQLRFLARMGYISIAHYLLYRDIIPVGVFKRRRIGDTVIYCFDSSKRWGGKLSQMMQGLRQAIEKKYVESAFIMINEDKSNPKAATEVFTVRFCYGKEHAFSVINDEGQSIVSLHYKNEKTFQSQTKHMIKKISAVTKKLKPLGPDAFPNLKLTYYPETPDDYEPPFFQRGDGTYTFRGVKPTFYDYGYISSKNTAIAFHLTSIYVSKEEIGDLDDVLYDELGFKDQQYVDPSNVSAEMFTDDEQSPLHIAESPFRAKTPGKEKSTPSTKETSPLQLEIPRMEELTLRNTPHSSLFDPKSSNVCRFLVKSPEDTFTYSQDV